MEYLSYDQDIESILDFFTSLNTKKVLIYDINFTGTVFNDQLQKLSEIIESNNHSGEICKISINNVPVDIYIADISRLIEVVKENMNFFPPGKNHYDIFLNDVLLRSFDKVVDLDGKIFFIKFVRFS